MKITNDQPQPMTDLITLKRLFDFTDADLAANRIGQLSPRQHERFQQRLYRQQWQQTANGLTVAMFLVTFVIYIAFSLTYANQLGPLVLGALLIWLGLVYLLSRLIARLPSLMLQRFTITSSPPPQLSHRTSRLKFRDDGEHRVVILGDLELTTNVSVDNDPRLWKLQENQVYTIYYIEEPLWIASIEPA